MKAEVCINDLYVRYHRPEYIHPDPLEIVLRYDDPGEREIAGFIASAFALGRVGSILQTVESILERLPRPLYSIASMRDFDASFSGFRYRFYGEEDLIDLLSALGRCLREYGSLKECFLSFFRESDGTVIPALTRFVEKLREGSAGLPMLPSPDKQSACKRLFLFLRWMVRKDAIDPGGWEEIPPSMLIVPVDTHMLKAARALGLTSRRQGDLTTALQITDALKRIDHEDPVKFDFSLTRPGIHPEFLKSFRLEMNGRMANQIRN